MELGSVVVAEDHWGESSNPALRIDEGEHVLLFVKMTF